MGLSLVGLVTPYGVHMEHQGDRQDLRSESAQNLVRLGSSQIWSELVRSGGSVERPPFWVEITGVEWSGVESIWTVRGTEKYCLGDMNLFWSIWLLATLIGFCLLLQFFFLTLTISLFSSMDDDRTWKCTCTDVSIFGYYFCNFYKIIAT